MDDSLKTKLSAALAAEENSCYDVALQMCLLILNNPHLSPQEAYVAYLDCVQTIACRLQQRRSNPGLKAAFLIFNECFEVQPRQNNSSNGH